MQMFSTRRTLAVVCLYLIFILFPIAGFGENTSPEIQTVGQINPVSYTHLTLPTMLAQC